MAILSGIPEIEVTICTEGRPLSEYLDDEDEIEIESNDVEEYKASRTVSRYIESTTGKEFSIQLAVKGSYAMDCEILSFCITIDGEWIKTSLLRKKTFTAIKILGGWEQTTTGVEVKRDIEQNISTIRSFVFSAVGTSNENDQSDRIKLASEHIARVGKIQIVVHRESYAAHQAEQGAVGADPFAANDIKNVHEKALKGSAKSHGTSLGAPSQSMTPSFYSTKRIDPLRPLAIFQFNYRSKKALQTLLVLPRTPEPEVDEELTEDQRKQVEEFRRSLLNGGPSRVKRENGEASDSGRDVKKARTGNGKGKAVVYDLTGDSD